MNSKQFTHNFEMPVVGLGGYKVGGGRTPDLSQDKKYIDALRYALSVGITHFDTAEVYGGGHSEEIIAQAINGHDREKLFITSKVAKWNLSYEGILSACDNSLKRLNTDYVDLYLLHQPKDDKNYEPLMKALGELYAAGKVKNIGVSNFNVEHMQAAQAVSELPIVANQIEYNLLVRNEGRFTKNMETEIIPYCRKQNIAVIAYQPLAGGNLCKTLCYKVFDELVKKYQTSHATLALAWVIAQPGVVTITKATSPEHIDDVMAALDLQISEEDFAIMNKGFLI